MRWVWLAAGPLLILVIGLGLIYGLPKEEKPSKFAGETTVTLPSGLSADFHEMLWNQPGEGLVYRFRFVAEDFAQTEDVDKVMADLQHLCAEYALPKLAVTGPKPGQVIISLANAPSEFGQFDPEITQVFEAFNVSDGTCIWEEF